MAKAKDLTAVNFITERQYNVKLRMDANFLRTRLGRAKSMYRKDLFAHYGCVNAIEFSSDGKWLVSGGDDRRVLLWNVQKVISGHARPRTMKFQHTSNIFCLGLDTLHNKIYSGGNDTQVIIHDFERGEMMDVFLHADAVYGLSVDPNNNGQFVTASDNGYVMMWDTRSQNADACLIARSPSAFHAVAHNPVEPRLIATANSKDGVALWDIRKPRIALLKYGGYFSSQSSMSVRFNMNGTSLIALRRRLPPVLYNISSPYPVFEFDHSGYYNSCTMKSNCFAGDKDQYIMAGSDDFKLYVWKIPDCTLEDKGTWVNEADLVLEGHRSIVNQVRYNQTSCIIASSGVEKIVKLWSLFPMSDGYGDLDQKCPKDNDSWRKVYSHEEYINLVMESGQPMTHDYTRKSMEEDPKMMAFFDSLVQRDIEGWTTDTQDSSSDSDTSEPCSEVQSLDSSSAATSNSSISPAPSHSTSSSDEESTLGFPFLDIQNTLTPQTLSYIVSLTSRVQAKFRALKTILNTTPMAGVDNEATEKLNRISELIVQKRNDQLLKSAQNTLKVTQKRLLKTMKKQLAAKNINGLCNSIDTNGALVQEERTLQCAQKLLDSVSKANAFRDQRDRRKRLRKRRVKIVLGISDTSDEDANRGSVSEGSEEAGTSTMTSNRAVSSSVKENSESDTAVAVEETIVEVEPSNLGTHNIFSSSDSENSQPKFEGDDIMSSNLPKEESVDSSLALSSQSTSMYSRERAVETAMIELKDSMQRNQETLTAFKQLKKKPSQRQYRKRKDCD